jgi:outer membrane receptor for ferrienterochelin and colicin
VQAQSIRGHVYNELDEPLIGATVQWLDTQAGTATNEDGVFELALPAVSIPQLVVSYIGYLRDTIQITTGSDIRLQMKPDGYLSTVVVKESEPGRFISTTSAIKTEVLTELELRKSACCDLAGCFNTQASVQPTTTNVVTNTKELRILGLSGVYNQVLIDGLPLIQGLSYTYGISTIPGTLIERIYVAKGANSVLQGFESISGQINVTLQAPDQADPLLLNLYANSFGEAQANINFAKRWNKWSTLVSAHTSQPAQVLDQDGDTFLDLPLITRYSLYNSWKYRDAAEWGWHSQMSIRFVDEKRIGGQTFFDPEQDRGSLDAYGQTVRFSQPELSTKTGYRIDDYHHIVATVAGFYQDQESFFGATRYNAEHINLNVNLQYEYYWHDQHTLKTGFSYRFLDLTENILFGDDGLSRQYDGAYERKDRIPGVFAENSWQWKEGDIVLLTGLRFDHHQDFGWIATPRALLKYQFSSATTARISAGKGWRMANIWSENVNLLASSRDVLFIEALRPEIAYNYGANLTHSHYGNEIEAQLSLDFYRTIFQNQIFPDYNSDPTLAIISNFTGTSISNGFQAELGLQFFDRLGLKLAYNFLDVYRETEGKKEALPFNAKHRVSSNFSFQPLSKKWHWDTNIHWTGEQSLANSSGNPPEFQQADVSDPYWMINTQFTKSWSGLDVYLGCENIFDFRQLFPIRSWQDPFGPYFDTSNAWGPTRGREFYLGLRYRLEGKE